MYNQQEDANTCLVKGNHRYLQHLYQIPLVLEVSHAPAWALTHCCLLFKKEEWGSETVQPASSSTKDFHQGNHAVTISIQKIDSQGSEFG